MLFLSMRFHVHFRQQLRDLCGLVRFLNYTNANCVCGPEILSKTNRIGSRFEFYIISSSVYLYVCLSSSHAIPLSSSISPHAPMPWSVSIEGNRLFWWDCESFIFVKNCLNIQNFILAAILLVLFYIFEEEEIRRNWPRPKMKHRKSHLFENSCKMVWLEPEEPTMKVVTLHFCAIIKL